jgi:Tol biopolymer transport system component
VALTTSLQWRDRAGVAGGSPTAPGVHRSPRLSPDQTRVALTTLEPETGQLDIWAFELSRGNASRVTFDPQNDWFPAWSSDGRQIFFGSSRTGFTTIFRKTGGEPDELFAGSGASSGNAFYPNDTSSDGRFLVYTMTAHAYDLGIVPLTGEAKLSPLLASPFNEVQGRFAPNSRWIAYASDESGKFEVYVRPFPAANGQWLISAAGGSQPEWRHDGKELFYISADRKMMAVPVTTDGTTFSAGVPYALFDVQVPEQVAPYATDYAVTADGQRFLVNTVVDQQTRSALTVVLNWAAELKK